MYHQLRLVTAGCLLLGLLVGTAYAQPTLTNDEVVALQVLGMVNQWRLEQGLWPLQPNATLQAMAVDQATYLLPNLDSINTYEQYHADAAGRNPRQRAVERYGWPTYGAADQVEIGENAGVGTPRFVMKFWQDSEIHKKAALSAVYREVGIAALPSDNGHLFMLVMGARPGVYTAQTNRTADTLYLSNDQSRYAKLKADGLTVRLFNSDGLPLTEARPWTAVLSVQPFTGSLYVLFSNGSEQQIRQVQAGIQLAVVPDTVSLVSLPVPQTIIAQPTAVAFLPTNTPNRPAAQATEIAATATSVLSSNAVNTPVVAQPTRSVASGPADLTLIYSSDSLVVLNSASQPVDLTGVVIGSATGEATVERWGRISSFPADAFPSGHCLQVDRVGAGSSAPAPCKYVRSLMELTPDKVFWTATFTVRRADTVLATCEAATGQCTVSLGG